MSEFLTPYAAALIADKDKQIEELESRIEEMKCTSNNAIYFGDRRDYLSGLRDVCKLAGMDEDSIGERYIDVSRLAEEQVRRSIGGAE